VGPVLCDDWTGPLRRWDRSCGAHGVDRRHHEAWGDGAWSRGPVNQGPRDCGCGRRARLACDLGSRPDRSGARRGGTGGLVGCDPGCPGVGSRLCWCVGRDVRASDWGSPAFVLTRPRGREACSQAAPSSSSDPRSRSWPCRECRPRTSEARIHPPQRRHAGSDAVGAHKHLGLRGRRRRALQPGREHRDVRARRQAGATQLAQRQGT